MKDYTKKLFSYFLSGLVAVILIGGCITPAYYSHEQDISLTIPEGATAVMDGRQLKQHENTVRAKVNRSWFDKEIIVKKEGYKDKKVKLDSVPTDDKWANTFGSNESWSMLFVPIHTAIPAAAVVGSPVMLVGGIVEKEPGMIMGAPALAAAGLLALPFGMAVDLFNIVVGVPTTAIVNPWSEYKYKRTVRDMEPLEPSEFPMPVNQD